MLETMTAEQYVDWYRYDTMHPVGDLRVELEFARLKQIIVSVLVESDSTLLDYMWSWFQDDATREKVSKAQVVEQVKKVFGI